MRFRWDNGKAKSSTKDKIMQDAPCPYYQQTCRPAGKILKKHRGEQERACSTFLHRFEGIEHAVSQRHIPAHLNGNRVHLEDMELDLVAFF